MEISLISPYGNLDNVGIRSISSYLKSKGYKVNLIFLPYETDKGQAMRYDFEYSNDVLNQLTKICKNSSLIGITVMANYTEKCRRITQKLKAGTNALIAWGGIHPTLCPEDCIDSADLVCMGEGEETFLELAQAIEKNKPIEHIKGIVYKKASGLVRTELRELVHDLDKYPDPDYTDFSAHYVLKQGSIVKLTKEIYKDMMWVEHGRRKFMVFTTRGCPHNCTFCCNSTLVKVYKGKGNYIRKRSIEKVIKELENIRKEFPFIEYIGIGDEVFLVRTQEEIDEFSRKYKSRINLPLQCEFSPMTITESKFKAMMNAGLVAVQMGIQSGSDHVNFRLYERYQTQDIVLNAARIIDKYKSRLEFYCYHFIICNPLESNKTRVETINFMFRLPDGFLATYFPLIFYPGAKLTEQAKAKKLISKDDFHYTDAWNVRMWKHAHYPDYLIKILSFLRNRKVLSGESLRTNIALAITTNPYIVGVLDNKLVLNTLYNVFLAYSRYVHTF